jgi:hypothetical protein
VRRAWEDVLEEAWFGPAARYDVALDRLLGEIRRRRFQPGFTRRLRRIAVRRFYTRPSHRWRRVNSVRSVFELRAQVREGLALLLRDA